MAKSWCKVSAFLDSHPKVRRAGNLGRQVFEFALRRNSELDGGGVVPASYMEPWYLADVLMLSGQEEAMSGLSRAVQAGLLTEVEGGFSITGWDDEWAKKPLSEAQRKRLQRSRPRNDSSSDSMSRKCPDTDGTNWDSPECHTREEKRREERESQIGAVAPTPQVPDRAVQIAELAIGEINRIGKHRYDPTSESAVKLAKSLAKKKRTDDEILLVIRSKIAWVTDEKMAEHFCPSTLLGPNNFAKYLDEAKGKGNQRAGPRPRLIATSHEADLSYQPDRNDA